MRRFFFDFCALHSLAAHKVLECSSKTPDFYVSNGDDAIYCEVKEHGFGEDKRISTKIEESEIQVHQKKVGQSVRRLIGKASKQFLNYTEFPCLLLIYCRTFLGDLIETHDVSAAMYGSDVLNYRIPSIGSPIFSHRSKGGGRKMTPENNARISAVGVVNALLNDNRPYIYHNIFASMEFPMDFFPTQINHIPDFSQTGSRWLTLCDV